MSNMSCITRKPVSCICENIDADQLRGNFLASRLISENRRGHLSYRSIGSLVIHKLDCDFFVAHEYSCLILQQVFRNHRKYKYGLMSSS